MFGTESKHTYWYILSYMFYQNNKQFKILNNTISYKKMYDIRYTKTISPKQGIPLTKFVYFITNIVFFL